MSFYILNYMKDESKILKIENILVPIGTHKGKTIVIGSDHRGFDYKGEIVKKLRNNYKIIDIGTFSNERCDYPIISKKIGECVNQDTSYNTIGIGLCGSGIGIENILSAYPTIISARCLSIKDAETSRKHNNSNVLCLGADCISLDDAINIINTWLSTPFYSVPEKEETYLERYIQTIKLKEDLYKNNLNSKYTLPSYIHTSYRI